VKTETDTKPKMRQGVRKRGKNGKPAATIELGRRPTQRCQACAQAKPHRRPYRFLVGAKRLEACPTCGGALTDTNERWQQTLGGFTTRAEAVKARDDARSDLGKGVHVMPVRLTVKQYLEGRWLPGLEVSNLRPKTLESHRALVKHHLVVGKFGDIPLQKLTLI
jgi:hypothetical protein